ncbi:MAG: MBL fold metallo-hydrolase [Rhodobiaceae bacterium]|nr:MBL fold metallo-hydrolase [Rhodobiaceae bacterium]
MAYEIEFLPVGESNGDAICVRHGDAQTGYTIYVVDGGYAATGQTIIDHINEHYGAPGFIDHVVLSHADNDHVTGLISVVKHFDVGALWMNRPWRFAAEIVGAFHGNYTFDGLAKVIRDAYPLLAQLEDLAVSKGIPINDAFTYTQIGAFTVMAPTRERYLELIPQFDRTPTSYVRPEKGIFAKLGEAVKQLMQFFESWGEEALEENPAPTSPSNESCIVQLGSLDGRTALLTADAGPDALGRAADAAEHLGRLSPPNFVQVPHHGSRRNVTPSVLNRWLGNVLPEGSASRGTAFCSVGNNKPEYPRRRVSNAFLRRGYPVSKTTGGWIRQSHDMPSRDGSGALTAIAFASKYTE